jgi:GTP-binding protein
LFVWGCCFVCFATTINIRPIPHNNPDNIPCYPNKTTTQQHTTYNRYAKRSKDQRRSFDAFTRAYLRGRRALAMVLLLVDASIPPQPVDVDYARWLAGEGVPFSLVFTKADKRKKGGPRARENVAAFRAALVAQAGLPVLPPAVVTSAATGGGRGELLAYIASLRVMFEQSGGGGGGGGGKE